MIRRSVSWLVLGVSLLAGCASDDSDDLISRVDIAGQNIRSVSIAGSTEILEVGINRQLQLLASTPTNVNPSDVSALAAWSSSNPAVASVSSTGVVSAVSDGAFSITGAFGPFSQTIELVASSAALQTLMIVDSTTEINECTSIQLQARGQFEGEQGTRDQTELVDWSLQSGTEFASFNASDSDGFLRTNNAGTVVVRADRNGVSEQLQLVVLDTLTSIEINQPAAFVTVGTPLDYSAQGLFDGATPLDISDNANWTLTVPDGTNQFATVDNVLPNKGTVNANQAGGGDLQVVCGGLLGQRAIRAEVAPSVSEVLITPEGNNNILTVDAGASQTSLRGLVRFSNGTNLDVTEQSEWTSTGDTGALDLSDSPGSRGEITIRAVGEIVVTMEYIRDGVVFEPQLTVRSEVQ